MSLLRTVIDPGTQQPRTRMFWVILGALAAAQLFAFWLLCSHQMRVAEARHTEAVVQQMVLSDCLQYIPGSTIASCTVRGDRPTQAAAQSGAKPALAGTLPVGFSYR
jgi:hypothetical protein